MADWQVLVDGRYRLSEPLGTGGMGRVWLARDEVLHRDVAIKEVVLPLGLSPEEREELRLRTLREARATARLSHPNVVQIYDVVHTEERPWIVMEYVASRSLQEEIRADGPMEPQRAAELGLAILAALQAAHEAGVLHRDVKPGNVLMADGGRIVLTDFGLAAFESGEGAVTRPGLVLGSPQYVAPERAREGISTPETDLWSLGATLYAAVEGHAPYARSTAMATLTALATQAPRPADNAGPLKPVLDGLLTKNPRTRMSATEAERLLRLIAAGEPLPRKRLVPRRRHQAAPTRRLPAPLSTQDGPTAVVMPPPTRGTRRWPWVAAAAALVAAFPTVMLLREIGNPHGRAVGVVTTGAPSRSAVPAGGLPACASTATSAPSPITPKSRRYALPSGWVWYDDPAGFSIAVPDGWTYSRSGSGVCFREPGGARVLAVERWTPASTDLLAYWAGRSRELVDAGALPDYAQVDIVGKEYYSSAADWEYRYASPDGTRLHALARGFLTSPTRAYAIYWVTPEFDWQANLVNLTVITPSFTPPG